MRSERSVLIIIKLQAGSPVFGWLSSGALVISLQQAKMGATESSNTHSLQRQYSTLNFLPKPITEVHSRSGSSNYVDFGMACVQGWRAHMEDAHIMSTTLPNLEGWSFFAVLDGHAGKLCAEVSEQTLVASVLFEVLPVRDSTSAIMDALRRAFIRHDRALSSNYEVLRSRSGTTCTSVLITPTHAIFSNLGDSRSVLSRGGKPLFATADHKPSNAVEAKRIRMAGGSVLLDRIDGGLAVSRAFGDFDYKMRSDLPPVAQKVSPEPETFCVALTHEEDEFLLLACDGVWDVMTSAAAVKYVHAVLRKQGMHAAGAKAACEALIRRCLSLGSRDNISAVIVVFAAGNDAHASAMSSAIAPRTPEEISERLAASVAYNAVASVVQHLILHKGTSVLPPHNVRDNVVTGAMLKGGAVEMMTTPPRMPVILEGDNGVMDFHAGDLSHEPAESTGFNFNAQSMVDSLEREKLTNIRKDNEGQEAVMDNEGQEAVKGTEKGEEAEAGFGFGDEVDNGEGEA